MFVAINPVSKLTYVEFLDNVSRINRADFLRGVIKVFPYKIHTVLSDNGMAFADLPKNTNMLLNAMLGMHIFGKACHAA